MMESIFSGSRAVDKEKGTNPQKRGVRDVRRSNLRLVVAAFRAHPTTSRVAIAKETGLSPSTVGSLVTELLHSGVRQSDEHSRAEPHGSVPESRIWCNLCF